MTKEEEKHLRLIGERIKQLRKKAGFSSQDKFAYDAEIPRTQYARYERGVNITQLSLRKIVKFHKITLAEFFKGIE